MRKPRPACKLAKAKLTLIRHSSVEPDWDGLVGSFKYVIDALVYQGILYDDGPDNIGESKALWKGAKPKYGFIEVWINEVE